MYNNVEVDGGKYGILKVYDSKGSKKNCNVIVSLREVIINGVNYDGIKYYGQTSGLKVNVEPIVDIVDGLGINLRKMDISVKKRKKLNLE